MKLSLDCFAIAVVLRGAFETIARINIPEMLAVGGLLFLIAVVYAAISTKR